MLKLQKFFLYVGLLVMTITLSGIGFHTAEKGMQSLVGTGEPPKSIHINADNQAIQVTVLGKQIVQPTPTLGERWSQRLESTKSQFGDTMSQAGFEAGRIVQETSKRIIEWIVSFSKEMGK